MELQKNIYCNTDNLVKGSTIKICYNGTLVSNGANEIYFHYGYGENWDNTEEVKMLSTELGFETEITLDYSGDLNFCLRDENNNWDNNDSKNYSCTVIEPVINEEQTTLESSTASTLDTFFNNAQESTITKDICPIVVESSNLIEKIKSFFQKIINYVPKIVSGTWKRRKTKE